MTTYDETGENDYMYLFDEIEEAYLAYEQEAGYVITDNLLDTSVRGMMRDAGWNQDRDSHKAVIDWFYFDWEYNYPPELSSGAYTAANYR